MNGQHAWPAESKHQSGGGLNGTSLDSLERIFDLEDMSIGTEDWKGGSAGVHSREVGLVRWCTGKGTIVAACHVC